MMGTNGKSTAVIVQRLKTGLRFLQIPHNQEFDGFTAAAWKEWFSIFFIKLIPEMNEH